MIMLFKLLAMSILLLVVSAFTYIAVENSSSRWTVLGKTRHAADWAADAVRYSGMAATVVLLLLILLA